jgi:hypothetical protein
MQERLILPADRMPYQLLTCRWSDLCCRAAQVYRPYDIADLTRTIRTYFASNLYENLAGSVETLFEGFDNGAEDLDRFCRRVLAK